MSTEISCGPGERRRKLMGASGDLALMAAYPLDEGINKTPLGRVYNSSATAFVAMAKHEALCAAAATTAVRKQSAEFPEGQV